MKIQAIAVFLNDATGVQASEVCSELVCLTGPGVYLNIYCDYVPGGRQGFARKLAESVGLNIAEEPDADRVSVPRGMLEDILEWAHEVDAAMDNADSAYSDAEAYVADIVGELQDVARTAERLSEDADEACNELARLNRAHAEGSGPLTALIGALKSLTD